MRSGPPPEIAGRQTWADLEPLDGLLANRAPPLRFLAALTPRRFGNLVVAILKRDLDEGRIAALRCLFRFRRLRFGSGSVPAPERRASLFRSWLQNDLCRLEPSERDLTGSVRWCFDQLGIERALATTRWERLSLEVTFEDRAPLYFLLAHHRGQVRRAAVLRCPPPAHLRLRISDWVLADLYVVDAPSGWRMLYRAFRLLGRMEVVSPGPRIRPIQMLRSLTRAVLQKR